MNRATQLKKQWRFFVRVITSGTALMVFSFGVLHAEDLIAGERASVELTVYNQGSSLIRERRDARLKKGINRIVVPDVPATLDPTSVHLALVSGGGFRVLEQNYQYDLLDTRTLLSRYVGRNIEFIRKDGLGGEKILPAKLLAVDALGDFSGQPDGRNPGLLAEINGKIEVAPAGRLVLPALPEGLISKPRLLWMAESQLEGPQKVELTYLAGALNWTCEYVALLSADSREIDLTGWVTLDNQTGSSFRDAGLKLVAGEVNRVEPEVMEDRGFAKLSFAQASPAAPQFEQKELFEYKLYTLKRRTDLANMEKKQIELVGGHQAKSKKVLIYDGMDQGWRYWGQNPGYRNQAQMGQTGNTKVGVYIVFRNDKASGLGLPLPAGRVRVYQNDDAGKPQLIGEDQIAHTPVDEELRMYLGNSFDVVGERAQIDFKSISKNDIVEETIRIKVRNHKSESIDLDVYEHPWRGRQWEVIKSDAKSEKTDQSTLRFGLQLKAKEERVITYTVRFTF